MSIFDGNGSGKDKGAGNGAMPAWENRLSANERIILAAYAASLRGTTPATPKPAEGDISPPPWPKAQDAADHAGNPSAKAGSSGNASESS